MSLFSLISGASNVANRPARALVAAGLLVLVAGEPALADSPAIRSRPQPLELSALISQALRSHPEVQSAAQAAKVQDFKAQGARSVYWPQLAAQAGVTETNSITPAQIGATPFTAGNLALSGTWDAFSFGKNSSSVSVADAQTAISRLALESTEVQVAYAVRQAYIGWLEARRLLVASGVQLQDAQQLYDQAKAFYQHGTTPYIDVTTAQASLESASASYIVAQADAKVARSSLVEAVGVPHLPAGTPRVPSVPSVAQDSEAALLALADRGPAILSAAAQLDLARREETLTDRTGLPDLAVSGSVGARSRALQAAPSWSGGVTLTVPIFSGFAVVRGRDAAHEQTLSQESALANTRLQVRLAVKKAYLSLLGAKDQIPAAQAAETAALLNMQQAEGRYRAGVGSIIEVSNAQAQYASAQATSIRALASYHLAIADLLDAVGQLGVSP